MVFNYVKRGLFKVISFLNRRLNTRLIYFIRFQAVVCCVCLFGIPYMYKDRVSQLCTSVFGVFLVLQIVINWICIRNVSSAYDVNKYGAPPKDCLYRTNNELRNTVPETPQTGMTSSKPTRTSFPYFSWAPCLKCDRARPPRCHHCIVCNQCILKRDHHCFFAGSCVGYLNYRYYVVFLFWATVASIYIAFHVLGFYYERVLPNSHVLDLFIPVAICRALIGSLEWQYALYLCQGFFIFAFIVWILLSFKFVIRNINLGITKFEADYHIKVTDTRPLSGKLQGIFGPYWMLNFLVPLHRVYEPVDNPLTWSSIKVN